MNYQAIMLNVLNQKSNNLLTINLSVMKIKNLFIVLFVLLLTACQKDSEITGDILKVLTKECTEIKDNSALCHGEVTSANDVNITSRGFCWSTSQEPKYSDNHIEAGKGSGEFSALLTGIEPNNIYYIKAYATTAQGVVYGNQVELVLGKFVPRITTGSVYDITESSAVCSGKLESAGGGTITEMGLCWSISENPTIEGDHKPSEAFSGEFTMTITNLQSDTKYYVRAYATNEVGTAYGEQKSFTVEANSVISVKDAALQSVLVNLFDTNKDGSVKKDEATAAQILVAEGANISSLEGLENYPNLTEINISKNNLTSADFSAFKQLQKLNVSENYNLVELDIQGCAALESFTGNKTSVTDIDFSNLKNLREIYFSENQSTLSKVNFTGCTNLETLLLVANPNSFTSLSLKDLPALKLLNIDGEQYQTITSLELDLPNLEVIYANCWRAVTSFDMSKSTKLKEFRACQSYALSSLDLTKCTELTYIYIPDALNLKKLDLSNNTKLVNIDAWNLPLLEECSISSEALNVVNLDACPALKQISLNAPTMKILLLNGAQKLESLDVSSCVGLSEFKACQLYKVKSLDLSKCTNLTFAYFPDATALETITFGESPKLATIQCWNCGMQSLDLSKCAEVINELNAGGDAGGACPNLTEVILRQGQTITTCLIPSAAELKYK